MINRQGEDLQPENTDEGPMANCNPIVSAVGKKLLPVLLNVTVV